MPLSNPRGPNNNQVVATGTKHSAWWLTANIPEFKHD
jgi:hypothetical protein